MTRQIAMVGVLAMVLAACGSGVLDDEFGEVPDLGPARVDVPRPTGLDSAPCDDDPLPPATDETTLQRVAALREIGLFAGEAGVPDTELAAEIDDAIEEQWGTDLAPDDSLRDLAVAEQDLDRVLWMDLEADVVAENQVYLTTLAELASISVGAFAPSDVVERWAGEAGPISVTFEMGGARHEIRPGYLEDWVDPTILVPINELIADTGRRFVSYKAFDQTAFVMALSEVEQQALEGRGWCFE
jgi:hypothetical protein